MFLTDCDKSHLFFRHSELQIWGAEDCRRAGDQSRSFGPGDVQAEALANRLQLFSRINSSQLLASVPLRGTTALTPRSVPPPSTQGRRDFARISFPISSLVCFHLRPRFARASVRQAPLAHRSGLAFLFLLWGAGGRETGRRVEDGE